MKRVRGDFFAHKQDIWALRPGGPQLHPPLDSTFYCLRQIFMLQPLVVYFSTPQPSLAGLLCLPPPPPLKLPPPVFVVAFTMTKLLRQSLTSSDIFLSD